MPKFINILLKYMIVVNVGVIVIAFFSRYQLPRSLSRALQQPPQQSQTYKPPFQRTFDGQRYAIEPQFDYTFSGVILYKSESDDKKTDPLIHLFARWGNSQQKAYMGVLTDSKIIRSQLTNLKQGDQLSISGQIINIDLASGRQLVLPYGDLASFNYSRQFVYINQLTILKKNHWWLTFNLSCVLLITLLLVWYDIDTLCTQKALANDQEDDDSL